MTLQPGFQQADPAQTGYQYLEDLSTAYWYSQVFFTGLELEIFGLIDAGATEIDALAGHLDCRPDNLYRLLTALERMALLVRGQGHWYNSQAASDWLIPGKASYMGDFFLYRHYMGKNWAGLTASLSPNTGRARQNLSYEQRNNRYVSAMDTLVRQKAKEISGIVPEYKLTGPVLDVGGGAGTMIRQIWKTCATRDAVLFDLPETIEAAKILYPDDESWTNIRTIGGDFRTHRFDERFGLIILSNFLHAYGRREAKQLLKKAISLLKRDGRLLVHDYFPDRPGLHSQKGAFYDLAMMLNTYNGACHEAGRVVRWLADLNIPNVEVRDLDTDSSIILAGKKEPLGLNHAPWTDWAASLGFTQSVTIDPESVVTAPWVELKCRFGCEGYGNNLQCPPWSMTHESTRELLDSYTRAVLVQGIPPGKDFHEKLLLLERQAFLRGFHKALVFGAGPCPACPSCPDIGQCRNPKKARPSMESCGIDVYATAAKAGVALNPVKQKGQFVKYIGLMMLE